MTVIDQVEAAMDEFLDQGRNNAELEGQEAKEIFDELITYLEEGVKLWCEGCRTAEEALANPPPTI